MRVASAEHAPASAAGVTRKHTVRPRGEKVLKWDGSSSSSASGDYAKDGGSNLRSFKGDVGAVNQQSEHLSKAQIENYGDRSSGEGPEQDQRDDDQRNDDQWVEAHVAECSSCRGRLLDFQRAHLALLRDPANAQVNTASTPDCPSEDDLRQLAAGLCSEAAATQLTHHAASCDHCGPLLRAFTEDFSDDFTPEQQAVLDKLQSSSASWQKKTARQMMQAGTMPADSSPKLSHWSAWKWVPAFSFVLLLAAGTSWVYPLLILHKASLAVGAEYRKGRPMKYRPAGVPYGRYKQELGGAGIVLISAPIIEVPNPERAPLLASNADLLRGDTSHAKSTLERALGKERPLPFLNNLAVAYAMEAEDLRPVSEQDKEAQKKVYQKALDITGEILRTSPSDPAALFNKALILERLGNTKDAITALEQLRQVEQDAEWREEATEELRRIQPTR
jgi:tetratricopeptide (TPR) repeat protein